MNSTNDLILSRWEDAKPWIEFMYDGLRPIFSECSSIFRTMVMVREPALGELKKYFPTLSRAFTMNPPTNLFIEVDGMTVVHT